MTLSAMSPGLLPTTLSRGSSGGSIDSSPRWEIGQHHNSLRQKVESICRSFEIDDVHVQKCAIALQQELGLGLKEDRDGVCQIPTYISSVAQGIEQGTSLSVDLGGTNLRVCSVVLHGNSTYDANASRWTVPRSIMLAKTRDELFGFLATSVRDHLEKYHPHYLLSTDTTLKLGFCCSYPVDQRSINSGILLRWTKGFDIKDAIGADVCQLLQVHLDRLRLPVTVSALVNDAAGTIMTRSYTLPVNATRTSIGAIFGTGTNGVYLERVSQINKSLGPHDRSTGEMLMSTEWGSFDNQISVLPCNKYDSELDSHSLNRGNQRFEKLVSGMFLGELLRLVLVDMCAGTGAGLFAGDAQLLNRPFFIQRWSVDASILSAAAEDSSEDLHTLRLKLHDLLGCPLDALTRVDAYIVQTIANAIGKRAARLAGMALGAIVLKSGKLHRTYQATDNNADSHNHPAETPSADNDEAPIVDVAVDGSVIELYPGFEVHMRDALRAIEDISCEGEARIRIGLAKDGSGIGAAIVALLAAKQAAHNTEQMSS